jgi:hypothetical protein
MCARFTTRSAQLERQTLREGLVNQSASQAAEVMKVCMMLQQCDQLLRLAHTVLKAYGSASPDAQKACGEGLRFLEQAGTNLSTQ